MKVMRFIVTVAFAWTLVRATFANTVAWRHPPAPVNAAVHHEPARKALASQRLLSEHGS